MSDAYERTPEFALIETIRQELGDEVEACPGFRSPDQAEPLNRVFLALARRILAPVAAPGDDPARLVSWALRRVIGRRLEAGALGELEIEILLEREPGTPDDWLVFLLLVPWAEVLCWLADAEQGPG
jgi:hypothetical protein